MDLATIVWISVNVFLIHEFEEIILIHPWLLRHQNDAGAQRQEFWRLQNIGTPVIAALIFEEYLLLMVIVAAVLILNQPAIFTGFIIVYTLHLLTHIVEAMRLRMHTPPLITSVLTLPWCCYAIYALWGWSNPRQIALWTVGFMVIIGLNFVLLRKLEPILQYRLIKQYQ